MATSLTVERPQPAGHGPAIRTIERDGAGISFAHPQSGRDVAAERLHRKRQLAAALRLFARYGVEPGLNGHATARDPQVTDGLWINPIGVDFARIRASDLVLVNGKGEVLEGDLPINTGGLPMHLTLQATRPEIVGILHVHAFHGQAWSAFGRAVEPIIDDIAPFADDQVVYAPSTDETFTPEQHRQRFADAFSRNLLIYRNHGHWAVGRTVEAAAWRFIAFEQAAKLQLAVLAAGAPYDLARPNRQTEEQREAYAALSFLPYWDRITGEEPDVLD
ncbi:class II aldolase/adducin family protein [Novosphingobium sp. KCTC 2891]|uniref:class II aldolase/adducin family protein n=1 Tax=Novosphingobium sp. KCTC 2891 TaxID=2989730 RepID=UPI00222340BA|nr:class II aldolase/adducin family protein [Novosphingobium sp. KCTC 2891]MCW1384079.1 class II aldolase/adducin family protein [Novosphingobium sp. KCTC 2891]